MSVYFLLKYPVGGFLLKHPVGGIGGMISSGARPVQYFRNHCSGSKFRMSCASALIARPLPCCFAPGPQTRFVGCQNHAPGRRVNPLSDTLICISMVVCTSKRIVLFNRSSGLTFNSDQTPVRVPVLLLYVNTMSFTLGRPFRYIRT